ncbi:hypothetical protein [uncultured Lactobacillus sp.]|uniref:hypothetical protein n=1 Tax=uncultured Lactobacillus sp. TaxID=153152 RepID=UPI002619E921|nr:hypothetical protein [uncultured Lactobacillus sp.]
MKVKILTSSLEGPSLEEQINDFIKDKKVIDIKQQALLNPNFFNSLVLTALIVYEED